MTIFVGEQEESSARLSTTCESVARSDTHLLFVISLPLSLPPSLSLHSTSVCLYLSVSLPSLSVPVFVCLSVCLSVLFCSVLFSSLLFSSLLSLTVAKILPQEWWGRDFRIRDPPLPPPLVQWRSAPCGAVLKDSAWPCHVTPEGGGTKPHTVE